ncbi:Endoplasmic reticulum transmembrane protein 1 [Komagataella phaffii CBS 7435]|uniref:Endoplasmic reticulum transmembrane protein n=2 Tax=Komagataella phaffii TaxID=460519 RepID=C4QWM4_KOMPG|nr:Endoplasmic reticulum transmembrane protein [Komagataella phaffii GS115]AOA61332.1 GQ67_02857T0 [Komagataella phaffii]CAH2446379.1 Endoplasmic reticulum transmembrane protein 1 [Komagataella phaffii CBS 7435]AOA65744.1 GQ68_02390T0 [Komagataella phaffii GS115]CAY67647.1 Endoplasmic reticulum transmembrane protein [Komagataella phaffii GS115]CCA36741.1 Endoplasmic reticulum transmembrane protein 1 [Komagataella phaffii CBS 7435]
MSLQLSIIFGILMGEMFIITLLVLPLGSNVRRSVVRLFNWTARKPTCNVTTYIVLGLVGLFFIDSFRSVNSARHTPVSNYDAAVNQQAYMKKFYNQRNMYITGATLFYAASIKCIINLINQILRNEEKLSKVAKVEHTTLDLQKLKEEIKSKDVQIEGLKRQLENLTKSYNELTPEEKSNKKDE